MIGKILGNRYKLVSELGSGGMAWVYKAQDLREGRQIAVKVLYPHLGQDVGFLQRFGQEAKLVTGLSQTSPEMHVVNVLDYGSDQDIHYLVMEYVPGRDLRQVLDEWGTLTWQETLDIGRQVALALGHVHQFGVVHRDVKPENIMLLPDGAVRVLDFGVARARTSPALTHSGFVGSPYYAAPEQAMGRPVDIRADLYSLGIVIYEMLTGARPFQSDTPWAVINHHIASPPPLLEDSRPDLPASVARLVRKAIAKRPEDRFQSPAEMLQAIEAVLAGLQLPIETLNAEPDALAPLLAGLYERAQQAGAEEDWQEAVDLFSQILKIDPRYRDVTDQLAAAGRQARLAALYAGAKRCLTIGDWADALAQLEEIGKTAPNYRDTTTLLATAHQKHNLDQRYQQGVQHLEDGQWAAAAECLAGVASQEPGYLQTQKLLATARARLDAPQIKEKPLSRRRSRRLGPGRAGQRNLLWGIVAVLIAVLALEGILFYRTQQPRAIAADPAFAMSETPVPTAPPPAAPLMPATARHSTSTALPIRSSSTASPQATDTATVRPFRTAPVVLATSIPATETDLPPSLTHTAMPTPTTPSTATASAALAGQIAFPRFDLARSTYDVYACHVDGTDCRRLAVDASQPDFLPDGSRLVVHSWKPDEKGLVLQSSSGQRLWVISDRIEAARPSVDFQGNAYVYHSREESDRQPRLYRTYGSEARPILRDAGAIPGLSPAWLPDGRILYSGCWQDACGIIAMHADGTFPRQVVAGSTDSDPEASPDGGQVTFMSRRDGNWEIYVVNTDGSDLRRLTHNPANDGLPTWSPDGRHIAFVSDRDGGWAVWVMRPDGSEQQRLFDVGGPLDGQVQNAAPHEINGWVEERISWAPLP
jgi:tetratricopeptide (TPR) repeat protein